MICHMHKGTTSEKHRLSGFWKHQELCLENCCLRPNSIFLLRIASSLENICRYRYILTYSHMYVYMYTFIYICAPLHMCTHIYKFIHIARNCEFIWRYRFIHPHMYANDLKSRWRVT